jgi:homoserine kinase
MADRLVEPVRARLVPCYSAVRKAALDAGAFGCALTGSGPAMFALGYDETTSKLILNAMIEAARQEGVQSIGKVVHTNPNGVLKS